MRISVTESLREVLYGLADTDVSADSTLLETVARESIDYRELRKIRDVLARSNGDVKLHRLMEGSKIIFPRRDAAHEVRIYRSHSIVQAFKQRFHFSSMIL